MEFKLHCWGCGKVIPSNIVKFTREEIAPNAGVRGVLCHPCWRAEREAFEQCPVPIQVKKRGTKDEQREER
jgi:hypothetical protein